MRSFTTMSVSVLINNDGLTGRLMDCGEGPLVGQIVPRQSCRVPNRLMQA